MLGMGESMVLSKVLLVLLLYPGLFTVCVRYVDAEGYLRGREITFNKHGRDMALDKLPFSVEGGCPVGQQGATTRVIVCLAKSSACHHDRTTNVYGDQVDQYFEHYPGSYRGKCTGECADHPDDCLDSARAFSGIEDLYQWKQWMRELSREGR